MTQFTGLCIDGPSDGKSVVCESPMMVVPSAPVVESAEWGGATWGGAVWPDDPVEISEFTYIFLPLWGFDNGFWIPAAEAEQGVLHANQWVMTRLTTRYQQGAGA